MDTDITDDQFRAQVGAWLRANLPADMVQRARTEVHPSREDMLGVVAVLSKAGWSVPHWPVEHGGPGWSPMRRYIFEQELSLAGGPTNNIQGVSLVGPVIYTYGTRAQKERYLAAIREGREFWSQGFSEPESGSDLASLRTRAVRDGDDYVVDGQKIWTSQAMMADMLFCLVRTDAAAKPQRGISFLLIPMKSPGITVRPIVSIDEGESLCEVFFDAVRVPVGNLVGDEGRGWDYAKFLLANERVQTAEVPRNMFYLQRLVEIARAQVHGGAPLIDDPVFRQRVAHAAIDLIGLEAAVVSMLETQDANPMAPSSLKVVGCELMQQLLGLQVDALGVHAAAFIPGPGHDGAHASPGTSQTPAPAHASGVSAEFLFRRAATIYGGSSEIQKNIISKVLFAGEDVGAPALTGELAMLRDSVERFARGQYPVDGRMRRDVPTPEQARERWLGLAGLGITALGLPESLGGMGGVPELAVACEALGAGLVSEPFVGVTVLAGQLVGALDAGNALTGELARGLIEGDVPLAFAHEEEDSARGQPATVARRDGDDYLIEGDKLAVIGGGIAQRFLVSASVDGELGVFAVDASTPGLQVRPYRAIDGQALAALALRQVRVPATGRLDFGAAGATRAVERALDVARVMACADAVGAMDRALVITRDYLCTRKQFGSALSEFQALRHRVAEMYAERVVARALVRKALAALDSDADDDGAARQRLVAACKTRVGRAAMFVANQSVQLHGGIGMTDEYVIGRYYKRLFTFDVLLGGQSHHTRRFAWSL